MAIFSSVLCALDGSRLAPRVLRHAVGLATVTGAKLTVVTFVSGDARQAQAAVAAQLQQLVPPGASYGGDIEIRAKTLAMGQPADAILDEARDGVDLIVSGTHSKSGLSRWLLGSTSAALLEQTRCPTLLVPPGELDIVVLGPNGAHLNPGAVLAAIALDDPNDAQLQLAAELAGLADQPLTLMTVAPAAMTDAEAIDGLHAHASRSGIAASVARTFVGRGRVATEIDRVAVAEHAGLVVMGLRAPEIGTPGAIANAVLDGKDAVVLTVPARQAAAGRTA